MTDIAKAKVLILATDGFEQSAKDHGAGQDPWLG